MQRADFHQVTKNEARKWPNVCFPGRYDTKSALQRILADQASKIFWKGLILRAHRTHGKTLVPISTRNSVSIMAFGKEV